MPILKNSTDRTGSIKFIGSSSPGPFGYLPCDGSTVSQSLYPALYSTIGSTYNTGGEPGGTFRLPSLSGKHPVGLGQDTFHSLTNRTLAQFIGEENHTILVGELPLHFHQATTGNNIQTHTHPVTVSSQSVNTSSQSLDSHTHNYGFDFGNGGDADSGDGSKLSPGGGIATTFNSTTINHGHAFTAGGPSAQHNHTFTAGSTAGVTSSPHNNLQPGLVGGFFIRY